jgi:type IV pilus assembly protein PilE
MKNYKGFNLLELLMTIVIISILSGIAIPAYQSHIIKARRADGQTSLFQLASTIEQSAIQNKGYQNITLESLHLNSQSSQNYYELKIIESNISHFLIAAEPLNSQIKDTECGILAMNDLGERGRLVGNSLEVDKKCWR